MSEQTIFKRYEIKYIITREQQAKLLEGMEAHMIPDEYGKSAIQSLYYDTPDFILARHSIDKPIYKEKLRLRSYGIANDEKKVFVELKKKYEGIVYKRRVGMKFPEAIGYLPKSFPGSPEAAKALANNFRQRLKAKSADSQIVKEIDYFVDFYKDIGPAMMMQYERTAYYASDDHEFRITFDDNIRWRLNDLQMDKGYFGNRLLKDEVVLMEVKAGEAMPGWFVKLLTENKIYQTSFSKYGTAYILISGMYDRIPVNVRKNLTGEGKIDRIPNNVEKNVTGEGEIDRMPNNVKKNETDEGENDRQRVLDKIS